MPDELPDRLEQARDRVCLEEDGVEHLRLSVAGHAERVGLEATQPARQLGDGGDAVPAQVRIDHALEQDPPVLVEVRALLVGQARRRERGSDGRR